MYVVSELSQNGVSGKPSHSATYSLCSSPDSGHRFLLRGSTSDVACPLPLKYDAMGRVGHFGSSADILRNRGVCLTATVNCTFVAENEPSGTYREWSVTLGYPVTRLRPVRESLFELLADKTVFLEGGHSRSDDPAPSGEGGRPAAAPQQKLTA
ncbi:hypothetical protein EVAR_17103_1 [Eumeta japonica]|uniref:Uncharacterized protein n=1 Tax=Eumeta variegata TaxID=151549 RepID=A0A4C1ULQ7_EUMVA|nr:hypothetical protein EVAR_17103_1 [Eumeta japonica]